MTDWLKNLRAPEHVRALADRIRTTAGDRPIRLMEVCGTHTQAIFRFGLRHLLPGNIELISGPGCPVCVTPTGYLNTAIAWASGPNRIVTTFGDMIRVPGSVTNLERTRAAGADIRVVYSPREALDIAGREPDKQVMFLAVGFETTLPATAATVREAARRALTNFTILSAHKTVPPALEALLQMGELKIDGFLLPGHVSVIIGEEPYRQPLDRHHTPGVITGFEAVDILAGVELLVTLVREGRAGVHNRYGRAVSPEGNRTAGELVAEFFRPADAVWRGIGTIPASGMALAEPHRRFDAETRFGLTVPAEEPNTGCQCGAVLRGLIKPPDCPLFGAACTPRDPVGPCMVSTEGSCAAYYKYREPA